MWEQARLLESLAARGETLATAESLTGGMLAERLTDVPGASRVFVGGVVSYATRLKVELLGVPARVVEAYGVVSRECACEMAKGARDRLGATWGVATTGVAGPDLQDGLPAGTVWVAVALPGGAAEARLLSLSGDRAGIRAAACDGALALLADQVPDLRREE